MDSQFLHELRSLNQSRFSGCLTISKCANDISSNLEHKTWRLYFYLGRIIGDGGGIHPVRRWLRYLHQEMQKNPGRIESIISLFDPTSARSDFLLQKLLDVSIIDRHDMQGFIENSLLEVLFDIYQQEVWLKRSSEQHLTYRLQSGHFGDILFPSVMLKPEHLVAKLAPVWCSWQNGKLLHYSPHLAPYVKNHQRLQQIMAPDHYVEVVPLLDGQNTLRDLAARLQQSLTSVTRSLMQDADGHSVGFRDIPDFELPSYQISDSRAGEYCTIPRSTDVPIIGHIGDNVLDLHLMQKLALDNDYGYLGIQDPLQGLKMFQRHCPHIIFLDLELPNTNTYQFYSTLRNTGSLRNKPVIMMANAVSSWHVIRGKAAGVTDFAKKPIEPGEIMNILGQYTSYQVDSNLDKLARQLIVAI